MRLPRAHHGLAYLLTAILVLMAVVGVAVGQLLPLAAEHPERIERWLSERAGRPVQFDRVETAWTRRGPRLALDNLRIGAGRAAVPVGDAEILVSQYAGLLPGRSFTELRVRGLDLTLERDANGRWQVRGLPGQQAGGDPLDALQRLGELQVIGARLRVVAPDLGVDAQLPRVHLRLRVDGERVRAGMRAWVRGGDAPLEGALDFDRGDGDGRAWFAMRDASLGQWAPLLRFAGVETRAGTGRAQAWARLRGNRVVRVDADLALRGIELAASAPTGAPEARATLSRLQGRARWRATESGWRVDAPLLVLGEGAGAQRIAGLAASGGARRALVADRIDLAPLLTVAALSDRWDPRLRAWLQAAAPTATLRDVQLAADRSGALRVHGAVSGFGFAPVGQAPGLRGLAGALQGDAAALAFRPDPAAAVTVDWPRGFGVAHVVRLRGTVAGWREGAGWRAGTRALRVSGSDYRADLRGGFWFQGDGTRPWIDLAADVGSAPIVAAKRFWLRNGMSPAAIRWLDAALMAGTVRDGRALVSGDLDHWPFRAEGDGPAQGRFHAVARIQDATIRFQPDWPAAERMDADVEFIANGLAVRGRRASLAGVGVGGFTAGIDHFGEAQLEIEAQGGGDAAQLLGLLRQSPLRTAHAETLANLEASGAARVTFALRKSLRAGAGPGEMRGTVALERARLADKRWNLAFTGVTGNARYGGGGFQADDLAVVYDQRPGRLSLRAGDGVRDPRQAFEGELQATLRAEELLERAPTFGWLRPRIRGASPWTVAVGIPKASAGTVATPTRLILRSNLVGTTLSLPAPLDKAAGTALATTVDVALPLGEGEVAVAFGERMALRARSQGNGAAARTGIRVALGAARVDAPPPPSGLVAAGRSDRLDALEWLALARGGARDMASGRAGSDTGSGLALRSVDVVVGRLRLVGSEFPETRLRVSPAAAGTAVRFDGRGLAGALMVPDADGAAMAGRLERLHWRAPVAASGAAAATAPPAGSTGTAAAQADTADDIDPAKIPPLNLAVADLRFGDAPLGSATLRTRPTPAGLRVVQLQTRAPKHGIDVEGDWTRGTAGSRTRLDVKLRSEDLGGLLAGFGFGRQVSQGKGTVDLQAQWPGSPAAFSLAGLQGGMAIDARDGQLVQVDPGAGRVLGLLSIAQLPRRLTFDFRDLFDKGFAFDRIQGDVRFAGGSARSDNLRIDGPAAEIRIRGAADLRAQTYDQTVDVYPKAGNLLTVAGALAGGPVGAAIGAAANAVLRKPLGQVAARTYRVTGPFKDPKVDTVERNEGQAKVTAPPQG